MLSAHSVVGRYEIQRRVAHGGMGTLYLAQDPVLGRPVALKLFLGDLDLPEARERFVREARAAAALNHPHIVTIYDYGEYSSQPYIVMEFIQGETLAELIRRNAAVPICTQLRWMEELCSAVEYAHAKGVIHRDLKPLNLMVDSYGRLKVLDFGLARMRGSLASHATARIGTAGYMAPEQIRGGNVDHRSDLFSIGVVGYELITHVEPFAADVEPAITNRILEEDPRPLQEVLPTVDRQLAAVVWKALRKDAAARFQDAASMREAFAGVRRRLEPLESDTGVDRCLSPAAKPSPSPDQPVAAAKQGLHDAGRVTPDTATPDKRADRDALVRKRTAEIRESVRLARASLESGDLAAARAECERVLLLDHAHPEALELVQRINLELTWAEAADLLKRGHAELQRGGIPKAGELLERAQRLAPGNPEAGRLDRALRLARAAQDVARRRAERFRRAIEGAEDALDRGAPEEALGHAREALEVDPESEQARALEADSLRRIDEDTGPQQAGDVPAPVGRRSGPPAAPKPPRPAVPGSELSEAPTMLRKQSLGRLHEAWRRLSSRQRTLILTGVAIATVVAVGAAVWMSLRPGAGAPSVWGVVVDAAPWATVKEVQRDTGELQALPQPASTPLALQLAPGTYTISLEGPPSAFESRVVTILVEAGKPTAIPLQRFEPMTPERYFDLYLKPKAPVAPSPGIQ